MSSSSNSDPIFDWLQDVGLSQFYSAFQSANITPQTFIKLHLSDFDKLGIKSTSDRQILFKLVKTKQVEENKAAARDKRENENSRESIGSDISSNSQSSAQISSIKQIKRKSMTNQRRNRHASLSNMQSSAASSALSSKVNLSNKKQSLSKPPTSQGKRQQPSQLQPIAEPKSLKLKQASEPDLLFPKRPSVQARPPIVSRVEFSEAEIHSSPSISENEIEEEGDEELMVPEQSLMKSPSMPIVQQQSQHQFNSVIPTKQSKISVVVRKRPVNQQEMQRGDVDVVTVNMNKRQLLLHEPKQKVDLTKYVESHSFYFDVVFDENSSNRIIYEQCCKPLVDVFLNKGRATVFAYG